MPAQFDVRDAVASARMRIFGMCRFLHQSKYPLVDASAIVRDQKEHIGRICGGCIVDAYGRHEIAAVVGKKLFPIFQTPFIEQARFQVQEVFRFLAFDDPVHASRRSAPPSMRSHCAHQPRIWASSVKSALARNRSSSRVIPLEISLQLGGVKSTPRWHNAKASKSSGVANPPGPTKVR